MNLALREQIIKHIYSSFRIFESDFINKNATESLINEKYLIDEKISFELEDGSIRKNNIWGCQFSADDKELKILLADCSENLEIPEFALIVQLTERPAYGCYLALTDHLEERIDNQGLIAYSLDGKSWLECNTLLQATFLSGMEQLKNIGFSWNKISDYGVQYDTLLSFIDFHGALYEVEELHE